MKAWQMSSEAHVIFGGAAKGTPSQWQCLDLNQSFLPGVLKGHSLILEWHRGSPIEQVPRRPINLMQGGDVTRTALIDRKGANHCITLRWSSDCVANSRCCD